MAFSVTDFLASPEVQVFETLKKNDLIASSMKKQEIKIKVANK